MMLEATYRRRKFRVFTKRDLDVDPRFRRLASEDRLAVRAVAEVFPFRINDYVLDDLIDWRRVPEDPIYQLAFPQRGMLLPDDFDRMYRLVRDEAPAAETAAAAAGIQARLNPHPSGQSDLNVPELDGRPLPGMQHKYRETVLFFPAPGQTCHTYCTYCFRWPQFVAGGARRFASRQVEDLVAYLRRHPEVTDILITGGDPLVMKASLLSRYVEPLLSSRLPNLRSIRIGTKALSWWPYRFLSDSDAGDLLRLFERVTDSGRQLALMAHYSHPRELGTQAAVDALRQVRGTGAVVRTQSPLIRHVNDDPRAWARLWRRQVQLGAVPYYMFVERDTGAQHYFAVSLARAHAIFRQAFAEVSGLARTVRGPSMSATPGKVLVQGVAEVRGERVFALSFLQGRDPAWVGRPFFARFDPDAVWLDDLRPAFGERQFFFEGAMRRLAAAAGEHEGEATA